MFTARYGLTRYIKQTAFSLQEVKIRNLRTETSCFDTVERQSRIHNEAVILRYRTSSYIRILAIVL